MGLVLCIEAALEGGGYWGLAWLALSFLVVGIAYAGVGPRVFGKRPNGTMSPLHVIVLFPYLVLLWAVWHVSRLLSPQSCCQSFAPGLWLGRRVFAHELPSGIDLVVDLTAEFPEPKKVREERTYWSVPTLDALPLDSVAFDGLVRRIAAWPGNVLIHCANGHGRSGMVAAGVLIAKGIERSVEDAERNLRRVRPGVRLNRAQRETLVRWLRARS
jgi:protein-tyrosine phosphatase